MKIFLSYGHDEHSKLALFVKKELEAAGYEVWLDQDRIPASSDWAFKIEQGIVSSQWVILLMTEHSVRRPDGVCLDEVSFARMLGKKIAPLMVQKVQPPLCIARIQWVDMQKYYSRETNQLNEEYCLQKIGELKKFLEGLDEPDYEGGHASLLYYLCPLDNDIYYEYYSKDFYGREWLFRAYQEWFNNKQSSRIFWLIGKAGIGKTAFSAALCEKHPEISAVHFCKYNDNERSNPKKAIMSIAFHLSTQLPAYREEILNLKDLTDLKGKNVNRLFEYLLIEPLQRIKTPEEAMVIVIDALDEATWDGKNELVDIVAQEFNKTPSWLKLVLTSRPEPLLTRKLSSLTPLVIEENIIENDADLKGYLESKLNSQINKINAGEEVITKLVGKCQGIFLYAKEISNEIISGRLDLSSLDSFPEGLTGIYTSYFERIFNENAKLHYKQDVRPLLELVVASFEPLNEALIPQILSYDDYQAEEILEALHVLFPVKNNYIEPLHKSLVDWLVDGKKSGPYRVSSREGHKRLAEYLAAEYRQENYTPYLLKYYTLHLLSIEDYAKVFIALTDLKMQNKRIVMMSLDSALRAYLKEIALLERSNKKATLKVLSSPAYIDLLAKHRRFIYNAGFYFLLKQYGFDEVLKLKKQIWSLEAEISCAYYHYITEDYKEAIKSADSILVLLENKNEENIRSELHNLAGCCHRKLADFDKAELHFQQAKKASLKADNLLEISAAFMNLAKIAYHKLQWQEAFSLNKAGIERLEAACALIEDDDIHKSYVLLVAEYYRLSAEALLWNLNSNAALEYLNRAKNIYSINQNRDRYYLRYKYSLSLYNIIEGQYEKAASILDNIAPSAVSRYDRAQIEFYWALALFLQGADLERVAAHIKESIFSLKEIKACLEKEEVLALGLMVQEINKSDLGFTRSGVYNENPVVQNWINHVEKTILKLYREG